MHVTFIVPSMGGRVRSRQMEPLSMAALAGLTLADVATVLYDDRIEEVSYDHKTDLVAITVQTFTAKRAYEIAAEFRRRGVPVVLGGFHVTAVPDEASEHADSVVLGEAEGVWEELITDASKGRLQRVYRSQERPSLCGLRYRRDIFEGKNYLPVSLVEFGRGCPCACTFCSIGSFYAHRKICRPVNEVVEEVKALKRRNILFADDSLVADVVEAKELFRQLIPLKIRWIAQASIDIAADDELLELAVASGCYGLLIGFESLNEDSLRQMRKSTNSFQIPAAISKLHDRGIKICASFVFGYDHDTLKTVESTLAFAEQQRFTLALFNHLTPYPDTPIFNEFLSQNRLRSSQWWLERGFRWGDVVFEPKQVSSSELADACRINRRRFYSLANIARRMTLPANRQALLETLAINLFVRHEAREKQGFHLGRMSES